MGPACWMVYPELRNRPVPITPPNEIICRWRDSMPRFRLVCRACSSLPSCDDSDWLVCAG